MTNKELALEIYKVSYLRGEFKLRSGQISSEYFDKYQFESNPHLLRSIGEQMSALVPQGTELLGAMEMGGIPLATVISLHTGLPVVYVRKQPKSYGTCRFAEGPSVRNKKVCLIEDVITTGGQVVISAKDLRGEGAQISHVLCAIDRSEGKATGLHKAQLQLTSLFTLADFQTFS